MKIVTYNVNGLRPRIQQFGSLLNLLNSLDADIICFQETKLAKHDLRADVVWADGYESFFSCTKARIGYSGVATFCRVASAFSTSQVALPLDAEEGFTGLLENSRGVVATRKDDSRIVAQGLEGFSRDQLLKVDSEGRCIVTDHGHFVLFNIYGPRAACDDTERIQFKMSFFKILQRRWESLLGQGRRVIVVGDLNIAPTAIDCCDAQPDFEKNEFREWFRSLLVGNGGPFFDVFRVKHPERKEAYTCWSTSSGAEIFNFGSRIDHILTAGSCLHEEHNLASHNFITCHVSECEILTQFKRWQSGNTTRWKGGRGIKLKGSDHAPVCMSLHEVPSILEHSAPSLSTRYCLQVEGCQQTLVSMLARRRSAEQVQTNGQFFSPMEADIPVHGCNESVKRSSDSLDAINSSNLKQEKNVPKTVKGSQVSTAEATSSKIYSLGSKNGKLVPKVESKKKARQGQFSQLSVRSFFQKSTNLSDGISSSGMNVSLSQESFSKFDHSCTKISTNNDESNTRKTLESGGSVSIEDQYELEVSNSTVKEKRTVALAEWQRIQEVMQKSIPTCKGHNEPCVARIVKKSGPNLGRRFFVCTRAEGPASNPEANCGYFKWASSKSKHNGGGSTW